MSTLTRPAKPAISLDVSDLEAHPVWLVGGSDPTGEPLVRPVKRVPVTNLTAKIFGAQVRLSKGDFVWGLIGNISADRPRITEQFLTLSLALGGQWFHLARYFDFDYDDRGPAALAAFLGRDIDDVFPIFYDLRPLAKGNPASLVGVVLKEPRERLTLDERIGLSLEAVADEVRKGTI
jgi:hypothetical protein